MKKVKNMIYRRWTYCAWSGNDGKGPRWLAVVKWRKWKCCDLMGCPKNEKDGHAETWLVEADRRTVPRHRYRRDWKLF